MEKLYWLSKGSYNKFFSFQSTTNGGAIFASIITPYILEVNHDKSMQTLQAYIWSSSSIYKYSLYSYTIYEDTK